MTWSKECNPTVAMVDRGGAKIGGNGMRWTRIECHCEAAEKSSQQKLAPKMEKTTEGRTKTRHSSQGRDEDVSKWDPSNSDRIRVDVQSITPSIHCSRHPIGVSRSNYHHCVVSRFFYCSRPHNIAFGF
jgi:hypothetical protein